MNNCPHCNANLIGGAIPDDIKHHYHETHWRREIGREDPEKYDGIWEYQCPDCKGTWPSAVQTLYNNQVKNGKHKKTKKAI